jgi:predicted DNA-binding transcriptional regulator AlpA
MTIATVHTPEELPAMLTMAHAQTFLGLSRPETYELIHRRGFPRFECQGLRFYGGWRVRASFAFWRSSQILVDPRRGKLARRA